MIRIFSRTLQLLFAPTAAWAVIAQEPPSVWRTFCCVTFYALLSFFFHVNWSSWDFGYLGYVFSLYFCMALSVYLAALAAYILAFALGARASYKQVVRATAYAMVPVWLGGILIGLLSTFVPTGMWAETMLSTLIQAVYFSFYIVMTYHLSIALPYAVGDTQPRVWLYAALLTGTGLVVTLILPPYLNPILTQIIAHFALLVLYPLAMLLSALLN